MANFAPLKTGTRLNKLPLLMITPNQDTFHQECHTLVVPYVTSSANINLLDDSFSLFCDCWFSEMNGTADAIKSPIIRPPLGLIPLPYSYRKTKFKMKQGLLVIT